MAFGIGGRIRDLLGHVAAGLEAVEMVEAEDAGGQERPR
jgi:hypothetical protein